jgi:hypothetical protein
MDQTDIIRNLELELIQPDTRKSKERLDELLDDDFIEIGESGNQYNKQDILSALPKQSGIRFFLNDFNSSEISPCVVLATFQLEKETVNSSEKIISLRSSIWKLNNGKWQIVFHQGTKLNIEKTIQS